uniref:LexA repressor DNA-binding domain-containing protein n=1 Tax=viral metagenome TaxID=1070528 RepID=A0A6M3J5L0_9ZZZZ
MTNEENNSRPHRIPHRGLGPNQRRILAYLENHKKATYKELGPAVFGYEITASPISAEYISLMRTLRVMVKQGLIKKISVAITEFAIA